MAGLSFQCYTLLVILLRACDSSVVFLQRHEPTLLQQDQLSTQAKCSELMNRGTHFTVEVSVGTPPQFFSVVADTGSNNLIVPSCVCSDQKRCDNSNRCFRGTNTSSTFLLENFEGKGPMAMMITFGSGQVQTVLATDVARVGGVSATMHNGLLLMTDQALRIDGPFEGILGLGLPRANTSMTLEAPQESRNPFSGQAGLPSGATDADWKKVISQIVNSLGNNPAAGGQMPAHTFGDAPSTLEISPNFVDGGDLLIPFPAEPAANTPAEKPKPVAELAEPKGFLEESKITRFSMCFKDGANGTLQLDTPPVANALENIGTYHWGLDLRGISLGSTNVNVAICSRENMTQDQLSACGAIPDSGTTAIMAPQEHLDILMESICDEWSRCRDNHTAFMEAKEAAHTAAASKYGFDPFGLDKKWIKKGQILQLLLQDCGTWLTEDKGLNELPAMNFQLAGKTGQPQNLEMTGWSYVLKQKVELLEHVYKDFGPLGKVPVGTRKTGEVQEVCMLALSPMEYNTKQNGPVWILGTPLFYSFQVGYDLSPEKPTISFTSVKESPCNPCGGPALVDSGAVRGEVHAAAAPRRIDGAWREPNLDFNLPL